MCKIFCLTKHNPEDKDTIIQNIWKQMALSQKDGYGAAWLGVNGEIGYYKSSDVYIPKDKTPTFLDKSFGAANPVPSDGGFLIIHGRTATCEVNVANTHPMLTDTTALVHNGVVNSEFYKNTGACTCDSELLSQAYKEHGLKGIEENINGYYAFMFLEFLDGKKNLHIARDGRAPLYCGELKDGYAFATDETLLRIVHSEILGSVRDNTAIKFTNSLEYEDTTFNPAKVIGNPALIARARRAGVGGYGD